MLSFITQELSLELRDLEEEEREIPSEVFSEPKAAKNVQDLKLHF